MRKSSITPVIIPNHASASVLTGLIALLSLACCLAGLLITGGGTVHTHQAVTGEWVSLHGQGLYRHDSVSVAAQGLASDLVTLLVGIPLLVISRVAANRGSMRAQLLHAGIVAYFLYTYMSYAFLWMYNPLFLAYVALMSLSFFSLVLNFQRMDQDQVKRSFREKTPVHLFAGVQGGIAFLVAMLWLGKILPTLDGHTVPAGLEHYTTLVIQAMDLGFVVPIAILSACLLWKRRPMGYVLTSIILFKGVMMLMAISAMIIWQIQAGVAPAIPEMILFPGMTVLLAAALIAWLRQMRVPAIRGTGR